jgi:hypothetical protein
MLALLFLITQTTQAQSSADMQAQRDDAAVAAIEKAILSLGGASAISAIRDLTMQGSCIAQKGSNSTTQKVDWTFSGNEYRLSSNGLAHSVTFTTGHGKPARIIDGTTREWSHEAVAASRPVHSPSLALLRDLNNPSLSILYKGVENTDQGPALHIEIVDSVPGDIISPSDQHWYFDQVSGQPLRSKYLMPSEAGIAIQVEITTVYQSYTRVSDTYQPYRLLISSFKGANSTDCTMSTVKINSGIPSTMFDLLQGGN